MKWEYLARRGSSYPAILRLMRVYVGNRKNVEEKGSVEFVSVFLHVWVSPKAINLQLQSFYRVRQEFKLLGWGGQKGVGFVSAFSTILWDKTHISTLHDWYDIQSELNLSCELFVIWLIGLLHSAVCSVSYVMKMLTVCQEAMSSDRAFSDTIDELNIWVARHWEQEWICHAVDKPWKITNRIDVKALQNHRLCRRHRAQNGILWLLHIKLWCIFLCLPSHPFPPSFKSGHTSGPPKSSNVAVSRQSVCPSIHGSRIMVFSFAPAVASFIFVSISAEGKPSRKKALLRQGKPFPKHRCSLVHLIFLFLVGKVLMVT